MSDKWDQRFMDMAKMVASWSKDPSTKCGAVIVKGKKVVGIGYNGFPRGVEDHADRLMQRELKYELVVHAEVNACLDAGRDSEGGTMYVWPSLMVPNICPSCAKVAVQAGIKEVVGLQTPHLNERWVKHAGTSNLICTEGGIKHRMIQE